MWNVDNFWEQQAGSEMISHAAIQQPAIARAHISQPPHDKTFVNKVIRYIFA
jgi:hypothetical protein